MMSFRDAAWFFFRLANFVILVLLFRHVFKHYFYQTFKDQIKAQLDFWIALRERVLAAHRTKKKMEETITHDEQEIQRLLNNVTRWRTQVEHDQQRKQHERDVFMHVMQHRQDQQEKGYQQTLAKRIIITQAFVQARQQLQHEYAQDEHQAYAFIKRGLSKVMKHE